MAVLVAQDHPDTLRRVPASGDGGIDLMVPDGAGYEVRQVKRFTQRIESGERKQIKDSWDTLRADPRLSRPITAYRLVMPVDPTPGEQQWFDELVADAPWLATWWGETHWHALASQHPHVIDYFFGGGRDRVARRSRALQSAIIDPTHPVTAVDVAASMAIMQRALNRDDPHYRYDLLTSGTRPALEDLQGCALAQTTQVADGGFLTIVVVPKHRYSLQDAPIQGSITIKISDPARAKQFQEAFTAFEHFGRSLDLPEGMVSAKMVAPGGLGGDFEGGGGWIGPAITNDERPPLRMVAVSDRGVVLAELKLDLPTVTVGPAGGAELHIVDATGLLTGLVQVAPPRGALGEPREVTLHFSFAVGEIPGRPVEQVLPIVRLLSYFEPPNEIQLRPEYGNQVVAYLDSGGVCLEFG